MLLFAGSCKDSFTFIRMQDFGNSGVSNVRHMSAVKNPRWLFIAAIVCSVAACAASVLADDTEPTAKSYQDRVCDFALLADGSRLTGIAISDSPARIVLRTERIKADNPDLFEKEIRVLLTAALGEQHNAVTQVLKERVDQLRAEAPDDLQQIGLLEEVIERFAPNDNQLPPWIIVEIEPKRLKRIKLLAPNRRELATLALLNQIDDFEDLHWKTVVARLQEIPAEQLKRPIPPTLAISPEFKAERILAAVDVRLNKATRLIRTGDTFIPEDAKPDLTVLLSSLVGDSLNNTLQELLNETGGVAPKSSNAPNANDAALPAAAIRIAEKSGHSTVVISAFEFDLPRGAASVTRQLFRNSKPGDWTLVSTVTGSSTTNDVTQEQVQKIEDDPQIKQISGLLSQLSPDPNSLKTALQMGAVVQSASSKADTAFQSAIQDLITARASSGEMPLTVVLK